MASEQEEGSANLYRLLVESITDYAIVMLDSAGTVATWNAGAERITGYPRQEVLGRNFALFYPADERDQGDPALALAVAGRDGRFEKKAWQIRKDGSRFFADVVIDPVRAPDGTIQGFALITRDQTDRRREQEDLRRSEENFRLLVQNVEDYAIFMLDPHGRVTNWNLGAQRIKGYPPEEIIGEHFGRFYSPSDRAKGEPERNLATARKVGKAEIEGWRYRKDGSHFWAWVAITAIRDLHGQLVGFAKITRDMTERRNAAEQLERAREVLFQSQKMESIGQLTGGVAHDFNNLLQVIVSSLNLAAKRAGDNSRVVRLLDNAVMAANRGATLTQRMLAFARRQTLNPEPTGLGELVGGMLTLLDSALGPTVIIRTRIAPDLPPVHVDNNQLETAILNLCINARDAMPEGGSIRISANAETLAADNEMGLPPGNYVCLMVADDGMGMDAETLGRSVEPFFTTKGVGKGTGLGLSMVHGLLEQSGGKLVLKSERGTGTTAEMWLVATGAGIAAADPDPSKPDATGNTKGRLTILNVDDDYLVAMNTTSMLEDMGHDVIEASSAADALRHFAVRKIDLLITDQAMPEMTGLQLIANVRETAPDLPVILATGYAELQNGNDLEFVKLSKPYSEQELKMAIERVFATARIPKAVG